MIITLLFLLFTKHLIFDFFLQNEFQWKNKGNIKHIGGYVHAGLAAFGTFLSFLCLSLFYHFEWTWIIGILLIGEFVAHYIIDYFKMNINKRMNWLCNQNPEFWYLLGIDQYLHMRTYLIIIWIII